MKAKPAIFSIGLSGFQRWATYACLLLVAVSGVLWFLLHDVLGSGWLVGEHRLLVTHGVAAALSLIVVGGLLPLHIRLAFRLRRNLWSGMLILALVSALGFTGLMLYYGDEEWRNSTRWLHIGVGVASFLALPLHVWLGKRRQAQKMAAANFDRFNLQAANAASTRSVRAPRDVE